MQFATPKHRTSSSKEKAFIKPAKVNLPVKLFSLQKFNHLPHD